MKRLLSAIIVASSCIVATAQQKYADYPTFVHSDVIDKQIIPTDTALRTGVLDNGLTYYVRKNDKHNDKVDFRLLVKAGSIYEKDNERGLAHFVEHMVFKGTKHFPGQGVRNFFSRNGIPFGHDSNAFTGFQTVSYMLKNIPAANKQLVDSCLLLMNDFASEASITEAGVEGEHGVIVEEWRVRNVVSSADELANLALNNSEYTKSNPIGDLEIVKNCTAKQVRAYYERMYQPQNQAIVVVGNIDPDMMVEQIRNMFGKVKRGKTVLPTLPTIPDTDDPQASIIVDKIFPMCSLGIITRMPASETDNSIGTLRTELVHNKINDIITSRFNLLKSKYNIIVNPSSMMIDLADVPGSKIWLCGFDVKPEYWEQGTELILKQIEYLRRKGFRDEDWKKGSLDDSPKYNEDSTAIVYADTVPDNYSDNTSKSDFADRYASHFFHGKPLYGTEVRNETKHHIANSYTVEHFNNEFRRLTDGRNMNLVLMQAPDVKLPEKEEVLAIYNRVKNMTDDELADVEVVKKEKLERLEVDSLDFTTVPGTIKSTKVLNDSVYEVRLSNGIKVRFLNVEKEDPGRLSLVLRRPQGTSFLKTEDIHYNGMLTDCVRKYSYGSSISSLILHSFDDYLHVNILNKTNLDNIESAFKYMYVTLTCTEVDSVAFAEKLKRLQDDAMSGDLPIQQTSKRMAFIPNVACKRMVPPTIEDVDNYNIDHFRELVEEFHSNYNGSVLVVMGKCNRDSIMPYILKYIAALPAKATPATYSTWEDDRFKTESTTTVEKFDNPNPFCATFLIYVWDKGYKYTQETVAHNKVLNSVLGALALKTLRDEHSDVYTPQCGVKDSQYPFNYMQCVIMYTCDPTQRERIAKDADKIIHDMAEGDLITQELIDAYIKQRENKRETFKPSDSEWIRLGDYAAESLGEVVIDNSDLTYIKRVTPASLKAHVKRLLKKGHLHIGHLTTE